MRSAGICRTKSQRPTRIPTGIADFDKMVGGGFVRRSNNLVAGSAGSGKTIFAIEYIVKGITEYNEVGMYLTRSG